MSEAPTRVTAESATPPQNAFFELLGKIKPELERRISKRFEDKAKRAGTYGADVAATIEAARELTLRGGKRVRAGLIAAGWIAAAGDESLEAAIDGGVAFELLQTYLLIQDDWMDGDATRRGGPSVHAALSTRLGSAHLGATSAILGSDMTWALAVETLATIEGLTPARRLEAIQMLMHVHEDVVLGQQIDVLGRAEDVEVMHDLKTGSYTMRGPLLLGATLAGGSAELSEGLKRFAAPLGVAFQLRDDLLGAFGESAETGKPVGADIKAGKRTALIAEADQRANDEERMAIRAAHGNPEADDDAVQRATRALVTSGARRAVEERQRALCDKAMDVLRELSLTPKARPIFAGVVDALRVRPSDPGGTS